MIWKLIPKKILVVLAVALVSLVVGAFGGYTFCKRANYKGVINQQAKDAKIVMKHQEKKDVANEKLTKDIKEIQAIPDSTGCLDEPSDDRYIERLLESDREAQSSFD